MIYLGIDLGLSGAMAMIDPRGPQEQLGERT